MTTGNLKTNDKGKISSSVFRISPFTCPLNTAKTNYFYIVFITGHRRSSPENFSIGTGVALQKIFLLERTETRKNSSGKTFGVTSALPKSTNFTQGHDDLISEKFSTR